MYCLYFKSRQYTVCRAELMCVARNFGWHDGQRGDGFAPLQTAAQPGSKAEMFEAMETWDKSVALGQEIRAKCLSLRGEEIEGWIEEA